MTKKPRKARKAKCILCGRKTTNLYWVNPVSGARSDAPFCARCYEDEFRRESHRRMDEMDIQRLLSRAKLPMQLRGRDKQRTSNRPLWEIQALTEESE